MPGPVRVLQVFAQMNRGGAETMIMNVYRNIDRTKVQFDFIVHTNQKCDYADEIEDLCGKIFRIPRYTGKNHFAYKSAWSTFFQNHPEYKIVHGHVRSTAAIYLKVAKKYGLITIAHSHSTSSGTGFTALVKNILQYPIRYTADYLFACSKESGEWLYGKKVYKKENFYIVKNAIDSKKYIFNQSKREEIRKKFNIEDKFVIGHVGRFHPAKNHEFLIDIFKEVHARNDKAVLMLVGDGDLRCTIKKKVGILELADSVIFTGTRNDIPELLQAMDIFVFPSLYEGLSVAVIEAQVSGLRTIISNMITHEIDITDLIIRMNLNNTAKEWADKILACEPNLERKDMSLDIKNNGFDIESTTNWLTSFYLSIL